MSHRPAMPIPARWTKLRIAAATLTIAWFGWSFKYLVRDGDASEAVSMVSVERASAALMLASEAPQSVDSDVCYSVRNLSPGNVWLYFDRASCGCTKVLIGDTTISPGQRVLLSRKESLVVRLLAAAPQNEKILTMPTYWKATAVESNGPSDKFPNGMQLTIPWELRVLDNLRLQEPFQRIQLPPEGPDEVNFDAVVLHRYRASQVAGNRSDQQSLQHVIFETDEPIRVTAASVAKEPYLIAEEIYEVAWRVKFLLKVPMATGASRRVLTCQLRLRTDAGIDAESEGRMILIIEGQGDGHLGTRER